MKNLRSLVAVVTLSWCAFKADGASNVLVFIDTALYTNVTAEIAAWTNQVLLEGKYTITIHERARAWPRTATNRLDELAAIRSIIDAADPAGVQFFGGVALAVTGWSNPDGHGARASDTDSLFMEDGHVATDSTAWGSTVIGTNAIGDGYWDTLYITNCSRPVARVAFQTLIAADTNTVLWGGCRPGDPQTPAVDEVAAFKDYIRRNLEYRRGVWRPERRGYIVGPLWSTISGSVNHVTTNSPVAWTSSGTQPGGSEGRMPLFLWENAAIGTEMASFFNSQCRYVAPVWVNTYRSYMMEPVQHTWSACYIRRWNQYALVSTWGANWWYIPSNATTVFDGIAATFAKQGFWWAYYQCWGDGTLPLVEIPYGITVQNLNVGSVVKW